MNAKEIVKLLDPKNQNMPKIGADSSTKKYDRINVVVFEGSEKETLKKYPSLKKDQVSGKKGELHEVIGGGKAYWIHGMGKREEVTPRQIRRFYGKAYLGSLAGKPKTIAIECPLEWSGWATIGVMVAALNPGMLKKSMEKSKDKAPEVILLDGDYAKNAAKAKKMIAEASVTAEAKNLMRVLGLLGPNILSTTVYAEVVQLLAKEWKVSMKRVSQKELTKYELINAVSAGSKNNPELLILTLHPKKGKTKKATGLFGKGLCYDSGGLQGKGSYMKSMKQDMAGSAATLATVMEIVKNKRELKETTHFFMPLAENMMGTGAMRADDIYTAGDGQKVEIIHTDAEGRLVLGDAICYAKNNYKEINRFLTVATLTGSCVVALGEIYTGVLCNNDELSSEVVKLGKETGDLMHVGPWDMEYDDNNSPVADVANLGEKDRDAGWIKAGYFLNRFVPEAKKGSKPEFCHFDIAGSIDMHESGKAWRRKGLSSGVAVGFLSQLLTK